MSHYTGKRATNSLQQTKTQQWIRIQISLASPSPFSLGSALESDGVSISADEHLCPLRNQFTRRIIRMQEEEV